MFELARAEVRIGWAAARAGPFAPQQLDVLPASPPDREHLSEPAGRDRQNDLFEMVGGRVCGFITRVAGAFRGTRPEKCTSSDLHALLRRRDRHRRAGGRPQREPHLAVGGLSIDLHDVRRLQVRDQRLGIHHQRGEPLRVGETRVRLLRWLAALPPIPVVDDAPTGIAVLLVGERRTLERNEREAKSRCVCVAAESGHLPIVFVSLWPGRHHLQERLPMFGMLHHDPHQPCHRNGPCGGPDLEFGCHTPRRRRMRHGEDVAREARGRCPQRGRLDHLRATGQELPEPRDVCRQTRGVLSLASCVGHELFEPLHETDRNRS